MEVSTFDSDEEVDSKLVLLGRLVVVCSANLLVRNSRIVSALLLSPPNSMAYRCFSGGDTKSMTGN